MISKFPCHITGMLRYCLATTYFQRTQEFYKQVHDVAMGNPLSPVIANIIRENFAQKTLNMFAMLSYGEKEEKFAFVDVHCTGRARNGW